MKFQIEDSISKSNKDHVFQYDTVMLILYRKLWKQTTRNDVYTCSFDKQKVTKLLMIRT